MPKVSVVLNSYNRPLWLMQSVSSVLTQTYRDFELLIMDDNSPDPRIETILSTFEEDHRYVKVHRSGVGEVERYETARYATMINTAVRSMSSGEYITYLTDDDFYYPHRLETMVEGLEQDGVSVVYGNQQVVDVDCNRAGLRDTKGVLDTAWNVVDHNSVMHTRKAYDEVDGWPDEKGIWGGADAHFWRRLTDAGYKFHPVGETPLEAKRYHVDSIQWKIVDGSFYPEDRISKGLSVQ